MENDDEIREELIADGWYFHGTGGLGIDVNDHPKTVEEVNTYFEAQGLKERLNYSSEPDSKDYIFYSGEAENWNIRTGPEHKVNELSYLGWFQLLQELRLQNRYIEGLQDLPF